VAIAVEAARAGLRRLLLTVEADNVPAVELYRSFGFTQVDTVLDFYGLTEDRDVLRYEIPEGIR
jgi:ribosomal protein S18 acetylase RimI-like enzyme